MQSHLRGPIKYTPHFITGEPSAVKYIFHVESTWFTIHRILYYYVVGRYFSHAAHRSWNERWCEIVHIDRTNKRNICGENQRFKIYGVGVNREYINLLKFETILIYLNLLYILRDG